MLQTCVCCGQEAKVVVTVPALMALCRGHYNLLERVMQQKPEARRG